MSQTGNPVVAPAPVVEAAPTPVTPATAPVEVAQAVPAVAPTPVAPEVTPAVEAPVAVSEAPKPDTVLVEALKKTDPVAEPPKTDAPQPEVKAEGTEIKEEGQSDEPAPPPTYDPFTLPEGIELAEDRIKEFTGILSEFEGKTKADHAAVQEFGQKAVDFHIAEIQKAAETVTKHYQESFENIKNEWKESFMSDPELGGNRWQTTIDSAMSFIRTHGGTDDQQAEFRKLMNDSGVGNHPAMIRLLANAGIRMGEGKPLAALSPVSPPRSKVQTMYGKN